MKWNVEQYNNHAHYVSELALDLVKLLKPQKGEYILDLGAGDGTLSQKIISHGASVLCLDGSEDMVKAIHQKGLNALCIDAQELSLNQTFDAIFSNAALHWMKNPNRVSERVFNALKPGGRFCAEFGAAGNLQTIQKAIRVALTKRNLHYEDYNPWYFPTEIEHKKCLEDAGFRVETINVFERPTPLHTDVRNWLDLFAIPFLSDIATEEQNAFLEEIAEELRHTLNAQENQIYVDYVRCRFLAYRE